MIPAQSRAFTPKICVLKYLLSGIVRKTHLVSVNKAPFQQKGKGAGGSANLPLKIVDIALQRIYRHNNLFCKLSFDMTWSKKRQFSSHCLSSLEIDDFQHFPFACHLL